MEQSSATFRPPRYNHPNKTLKPLEWLYEIRTKMTQTIIDKIVARGGYVLPDGFDIGDEMVLV